MTDTKLLPLGIADGYWIKDNEIHDVVKMIDDGGGTYLWGRQGANGVISGNAIHDINGRGLYFDDATSGYRIESNVFYRLKEPIAFYGQSDRWTFKA